MPPVTKHEGHDGETLAQAWDRLCDNVEDLWDRHRKSRGRLGWKDLPHALVNIPVSAARDYPKLFGKGALAVAAAMLALIAWAVWW
jgi:ferric-dicitrate binding protein FerR (iron transport regulator)